MKLLCLCVLYFCFCQFAMASSTWEDTLRHVKNLENIEKTDSRSRILPIIIGLRRAWIAVADENLNAPAYKVLKEELVSAYKMHRKLELADWYKTASIEQINKKMQEKYQEGKKCFLESWRARMDEFGMITIWNADSLKPRQQPIVFYYKPGDEDYADAVVLSKLEPNREKKVDFDLSSLAHVAGPTFGKGAQLDW